MRANTIECAKRDEPDCGWEIIGIILVYPYMIEYAYVMNLTMYENGCNNQSKSSQTTQAKMRNAKKGIQQMNLSTIIINVNNYLSVALHGLLD